ncbi:hypothetical protein GWK47_013126 [Chionoecetes opilio]|uniref:Uncharacterized protein n=1 Tax=Chionoecetes opilio TaxID=41210 RepID=A0A8J4XWC7_CHIOP|nr:hypothetical protein GWK47_013126 [Chionoecetes opilio]
MCQGTAYAPENVLKLVRCSRDSEKACRGGKCGCMSRQLPCTVFCACGAASGVCHNPFNLKDEEKTNMEEECIDMSSTRSTDKLWLVGAPATQELPSSVLPNREEVLCVLQYHAKLNPRDLAFSVRQTALNVQHQYSKANIPTIDPCDILKKVRRLHEEYNGF